LGFGVIGFCGYTLPQMITLQNISKAYGVMPLFDEVTFTVNKKERIGVLGRNGYGKSTLLKIILDEVQPDDGKVIIPKNYRIAALEQHINFTQSTVLAEAAQGLRVADEQWRAEMILSGLGFAESDFARPPSEFSGGYQLRINLAKVLLAEPDLLLLDEPTNYLDIVAMRWLERFLSRWTGEFLLVTHDRKFMDAVTTHTLSLHRGKVRKTAGGTVAAQQRIDHEETVHENTRVAALKKEAKTKEFISKFRAGARSAGLVQSRIKMLAKQDIGTKLDSGAYMTSLVRIASGDYKIEDAMTIEEFESKINKLNIE